MDTVSNTHYVISADIQQNTQWNQLVTRTMSQRKSGRAAC